MSENKAELVKKTLVIYGRNGCVYCTKAKELAEMFKESGSIQEIDYRNKDEVDWTREDLAKYFNMDSNYFTSVPQIGLEEEYSNGNKVIIYIGGYNQLVTSTLY